jgi:hypothetical protein
MIIMPANSSGWFWHSLARETGRIGHLYSPGDQRGPWPWIPFALDNGAFSCWDMKTNVFNYEKWQAKEIAWRQLLFWVQASGQECLWAIVPDVPGNSKETLERWPVFAPEVIASGIPLALAVQDGMTPDDVRALDPAPDVICVGGGDEFKWGTVELWPAHFPHCHLLRCNMPEELPRLHALGYKSCDGTGWAQGTRSQTRGLEEWCRRHTDTWPRISHAMWPHTCRGKRKGANKNLEQTSFA